MDGYLSRLDDERLAKLSAGDGQRAFTALYERHHRALYRYCATIVRDDADAHDALQATWMRALVALRRGQRDAPLRPWLYRIAHNESVSILRRRGRGAEPLHVPACPLASAEDGALQRERFAQLVADLHALPERPRSALVLRELTGLSHEEIALTLETTVATAKQSIYEARCGLQDLAQGRAMACAELRRRVSDGDRRVLRGRRVRAHVRHCPECAAFAAAMADRRATLSALVPALPAAASWEILRRLSGGFAGGAAAGGGAIGGGAATGAGGAAAVASKALGAGFAAKSLALTGVALTAAAVTVTVTGVTGSHTPRFQPSASHASAVASHHRGGAGSRPTTAAAQQPAATTIVSAPLLVAAPPGTAVPGGALGAGRRHGRPDGRGGLVAARGGPVGALDDRGTPGAGGSAAGRANGANGSSASAPGATPGNSAAANAGLHGSSAAAHGSSAAAHAGAHRGSAAAHASSAAQQDDAAASGGGTAAPTGATTAAVPAEPGNSAAAHARNAHK